MYNPQDWVYLRRQEGIIVGTVFAQSQQVYCMHVFITFVKLWNRPWEADVMWRTNMDWMCLVSSAAELELAHVLCYDRITFSVYVTFFKE